MPGPGWASGADLSPKAMQGERTRYLKVAVAEAGFRLDRFLSGQLGISRGAAGRLIAAGAVQHRGRPARGGTALLAGDLVAVDMALAATGDAAQPDPTLPLCVCFEDEDLVVVDKPAGMPSHPLRPGERGTLASALLARYPEMARVGHSPREPGLIHRLDIDTSGLLIAARHRQAFAALREALVAGRIDKRYEALVAGQARPGAYIGFLAAQGATVRVYEHERPDTKRVLTEVLISEPCGDHSRVALRVRTAARHQIRAHMAHIGHPLYGDVRYGGRSSHDGAGHVLHAAGLRFEQPRSGRPLVVSAPAPSRFEACAAAVLSGEVLD